MHVTTVEVTIRRAEHGDRLAICSLLQQAWHSAGTARWDQLDALERGCEALLACRDAQTAGFALFDLRTLPVARLSAVAISDREQVEDVWRDLWPSAEQYLAERGIESVYYVGEAPWLLGVLEEHGFKRVSTVVSYEKVQDAPGPAGHAGVRLRPVRERDLEMVASIDEASFPPLWRYPRPMLEAALQSSTRFTVAELDHQPVGYEVSTQEGSEGQIIRLAVLPEYRRQGVASRLASEALAAFRRRRVRRLALNTQSDNLAARQLYERFGFRFTGEELPVLEKTLSR